jgi:hypothetical protein
MGVPDVALVVSRALNHSDVKTTMRYAHVMDGEVAALCKTYRCRGKSPTKNPTRPRLRLRKYLRSMRKLARGRYVFETEGWRFEPVRARHHQGPQIS